MREFAFIAIYFFFHLVTKKNAKYDCFSMHIKEEDRGTKTRHTCWSLEDRILILLLVTHPVPNSAQQGLT